MEYLDILDKSGNKTGKTEGKEMKKIWKGQLFTGTKADFYGGKAAEGKKNRQIKVE